MEKEKFFLSWEDWNKIKNIEYMTLNNIANINNHHLHVHFNNNNSSLVPNLRKWGEISSTTSLLLIRTSSTSGFRNGSVFTSSGSILCSTEAWFRNHSVFTTSQHSNIISDVKRHQTSSDGTRTEQIFTPRVNFITDKSRYFQHQFKSKHRCKLHLP